MNRRNFFKYLGIGTASLSVNPVKFLMGAPLVEKPDPLLNGTVGRYDGTPIVLTRDMLKSTLTDLFDKEVKIGEYFYIVKHPNIEEYYLAEKKDENTLVLASSIRLS